MKLHQIKPNFTKLSTPYVDVWFSYETPIAFQELGKPVVVRENEWGPTTGKHLNAVSGDKATRISGEKFQLLLAKTIA